MPATRKASAAMVACGGVPGRAGDQSPRQNMEVQSWEHLVESSKINLVIWDDYIILLCHGMIIRDDYIILLWNYME